MDLVALAFVLISAGMHAAWNFWAKQAKDSIAFLWWLNLLAPVVAVIAMLGNWAATGQGPDFSAWQIAIAGGFVQALYMASMGAGYNSGDLSVVYPVARGVAPVIIALLGWIILKEVPSSIGMVAIVVVLGGTLVLAWDLLHNGGKSKSAIKSLQFALFAALNIALYHVVDKYGAKQSSVFSYQFLMEVWLVVWLTPILLMRRKLGGAREEIKINWKLIVLATVLMYTAYCLVIAAMMRESAAYVAAARNISILAGVALGAVRLKEGTLSLRLLAGGLILTGIVALAIWG